MRQSLALEYCSLHSPWILGEVCSPLILFPYFGHLRTTACLPARGAGRGWAGVLLPSFCGQSAGLLLSSVFWTCWCASLVGSTGTNNSLVLTRLIAIAVLVISTGYSFNPCLAVSSGAFTHRHFHSCFMQTNLNISITNPNTGRGKNINFFNKS